MNMPIVNIHCRTYLFNLLSILLTVCMREYSPLEWSAIFDEITASTRATK